MIGRHHSDAVHKVVGRWWGAAYAQIPACMQGVRDEGSTLGLETGMLLQPADRTHIRTQAHNQSVVSICMGQRTCTERLGCPVTRAAAKWRAWDQTRPAFIGTLTHSYRQLVLQKE